MGKNARRTQDKWAVVIVGAWSAKSLRIFYEKRDYSQSTLLVMNWSIICNAIYQAAQRHVYTSDPFLVRVLHPCLLSILTVVEPSPQKSTFGRKVKFSVIFFAHFIYSLALFQQLNFRVCFYWKSTNRFFFSLKKRWYWPLWRVIPGFPMLA